MVSKIANLDVLAVRSLMAAPVKAKATKVDAPLATAAAPVARATPRPGTAGLSSSLFAAMIHAQEHGSKAASHGRSVEAHLEHKKPKKPKPHDPAPTPTPTPTPVQDISAPARFLDFVRDQIHAEPVSQFPDTPFSQRGKDQTPQPSALAQASAFYTPGSFTPAQASAMRTVAQGQAGLALLQSAQMNLYGESTAGSATLGLDRLI